MVGLSISFLINRYSTKIFSVNASIIIKEAEEVSGGRLLYNNPLVKFYRNYLNELYIIKSNPLFERTIAQLGFEHKFLRVGNVLTTEFYRILPVSAAVTANSENKPFRVRFEILNDTELRVFDSHDTDHFRDIKFGDKIAIDKVELSFIRAIEIGSLDNYIGQTWLYSFTPKSTLAQDYVGRLTAAWAEEGAGVINLSINGPDPQKEIDFIKGLIENYQDYDLEKKNETASNTLVFINAQLSSISDSLNKAERQLQAFKNKNVVTDLNTEAKRLYEKMEALEIQKTELIVGSSYYDYLEAYINKSNYLDQVILPSSVGVSDPILAELLSQLVTIQTELKSVSRADKLQNPLIEEKRRVVPELKKDIIESIQGQKSVQKIKMDFLNKGIKELESQLNYLPLAERQLVIINRNYSLLENLYIFLLQKHAEAGISKASNTSDIVVVNPPLSTGPISPSKSRNNLIGFLAGLAVPALIILLLELLNTRVQSKEDIEKMTTIPFIGGVGHKRGEQNLEVLNRPKSSISESFRALRSNLNYFLKQKEKGVFLITSSVSGEGKTFTSINLAAVFALSGKKTLIVGADMRKPRLFDDFALGNDRGLSNYLASMSDFEDIVQHTTYDNLDLISGGSVPPNPSELLLTKRMDIFLEEAKSRYDFIFIDSPPLALVTDAFVLSSMVDLTLFIVRQNYTPKSLLKTIDDYFQANKITRISVVLNDIYKSGPGYGYGYSYGYGYGYGYGAYGYGARKKNNGYYEED